MIFTLLFPFLFFLLTEVILQASRFGPNVSLFVTQRIGGRTYGIMNPDVKSRYFARVAFSPSTSLDYFEIPKPRGTFRIFCLGGSTTIGFPYGVAGAFPALLKDRLQRVFPDRRFDVINLGMTATNSFTVADIAAELPAYEPDLVIVYDGHNEFYGALGLASRESIAHSRWVTRLYLKAVHLKTFLALRDLLNMVRGGIGPDRSGGGGTLMERLARGQYIPRASEEYTLARDIFRANIQEVASINRGHGIPVIFGTQTSNLRDLPPFVSEHSREMPPARRLEFASAMNRGLRERADGMMRESLHSFREALASDSLRADAWFEAARALDLLGRYAEADSGYIRARDLDRLRFRTSSDFNAEIAAAGSQPGVYVADMESAFRQASPHGLIGSTLILEHLHPNMAGYFLMAKEFARVMQSAQLVADDDTWRQRDTIPEDRLRSDAHLTQLDSMAAARRIALLTSGWPFRDDGGGPIVEHSGSGLAAIVDEYISGGSTWEEAHASAAEFYRAQKDTARLAREYRTIIRTLPVNVSAYLLLARVYLAGGRRREAAEVLQASLLAEETLYASSTLGSMRAAAGKFSEAVPHFERAVGLSENGDQRTEHRYFLAAALHRAGHTERAVAELRGVLEVAPGYTPARNLLRALTGN
jgi:tetratricopeptide (TPR) repeat protein